MCDEDREEDGHESWDKCIRHGAWTVGLGMVLGTAASVFLVSETPIMMGTGLGVGWAMKYCRSQFRKEAQEKELLTQKEEENIGCQVCPSRPPEVVPQAASGSDDKPCGINDNSQAKESPPSS